jgi:catechol 2,3-dioxygenase-like lactoylglutathione lyase family enzyme
MIRGFSQVALSVRRLDVAIDFYVRFLGFTLSWSNVETAYLGSRATSIVLIEPEDAISLPPGDSRHTAFVVPSEVLGKLGAALQAGKIHYWRQETPRSKSIYCFDPDKHKLELFAAPSLVDKSCVRVNFPST